MSVLILVAYYHMPTIYLRCNAGKLKALPGQVELSTHLRVSVSDPRQLVPVQTLLLVSCCVTQLQLDHASHEPHICNAEMKSRYGIRNIVLFIIVLSILKFDVDLFSSFTRVVAQSKHHDFTSGHSQRAHDVTLTSYQCHRRRSDVIMTSCACWVLSNERHYSSNVLMTEVLFLSSDESPSQ